MRKAVSVLATALGLMGVAPQSFAQPIADPVHGEAVFKQSCAACHTGGGFNGAFTGPQLDGVIGRKAGSKADFEYSTAMKAWAMVWTPALLDQFLTKPSQLIPGTMMAVSLPADQDRADLIAFLATLK